MLNKETLKHYCNIAVECLESFSVGSVKWLEAEVAIGNTVRGNYACINYCYHGGAMVVCH